ncbi:MAG: bifunctional 5,10-methylenetetrahydrofolate dehydrogenase/5,10-methenyltetrahydrofolate cyclohydrolase [Candidatus Omnitrophica bacterium]|nr:bifunctional 5,10-methylenetetrahydrofolate dehydrogenase/5,10-methenyltetrahydrofolate cyclohydrolase [Candidatus Omnitrophota bacterium]MDD5660695.1 bifunctional 5,10-methylenetetrahydrofolate dehydrogenase/5,10-methenyltetrahydrofolate cyclohydrolase [Candidatus Omnitrophota bacterium]
MAKLLEGKPVAEKIKEAIRLSVQNLKQAPVLASILVGNNLGAASYVSSQEKTAASLGIAYRLYKLNDNITENVLIDLINKLNADKTVNGIIVQTPLGPQMDYRKISEVISAQKDAEGMHPLNMGHVIFGNNRAATCTASAVMELLNSTGIDLCGKETVVVGSSEIVGKPLALLLLERLATVTICHIGTSKAGKLKEHVRKADLLISAVGQAGIINGEWIKKGAIVVDVGINRANGKIVGDVGFQAAEKRASYITPVPGGVGPLTVVILMRNLVEAAKLQQ